MVDMDLASIMRNNYIKVNFLANSNKLKPLRFVISNPSKELAQQNLIKWVYNYVAQSLNFQVINSIQHK